MSADYDDLATLVRQRADAAGVMVIVIEGRHGSGFSVQANEEITPKAISKLLRQLADEVEQDLQSDKV